MSELARWVAGAALAAVIVTAAGTLRWLTASGAVAAFVLGTLAVGAGWDWGTLLVVYFLTANALSAIGRRERERRTDGRLAKAGARDALQVLANGGLFAAAAALFVATGNDAWRALGLGALAASAADTWATEIGTLSRASARSVLTGRVVPAGTSGGVTVQGVMAGVAGAAVVASVASAFGWPRATVNAALFGGVAGSLLDSVLGASVQARRWCPRCQRDTEERVHRCGAPTERRGGLAWLDNDGVNLLCTVAGGATALLLARWL